jgi:UPF0176 protein
MLTVAAFYHFTRLPRPETLRPELQALCRAEGVRGTLLLAPEGINGTLAGTAEGIAAVLARLRQIPGCAGLVHKQSWAESPPFPRLKVRVKREIVTMGQPDVDPAARAGHYVAPQDWNALIADPDVAVIDTRNAYEVQIGRFAGAVDPGTGAFREFPEWWAANAERFSGKRIAMYCTGGIRCEKSTNWLIGQGVADVYHLQGGILKYLEEVPEAESLWQGECYVFDRRVSVKHGLEPGDHSTCHACRRPLAPADRDRPEYERGAACHQCIGEYSEADRDRFRERQRQMDLARARGVAHIGG